MIVGKLLGRYELLEQLGEGGMGSVWLARLTGAAGFEKLCIVKTVLPSIAKDADFVSRFLHEGRVLTQLSHGNIAQVLDMNEVDGQLFLALEYVAGVDLSRLQEQVRAAQEYMPLDLVVALIAQAAEGLGAAHRKAALDGSPLNIVHRDVSPHNIMVSYEGEVKVIDFGIAKSEARSRHTAQASVMGKLGYMAPEQARGDAVDHRADQYALSIVLWELLANQSWVRRGTLTEMVVAMAHPPPPKALGPLRPDVPPSLEAVVLKALSPLAEGRYATTDEFAQGLMGELLKLGPPPTKPQLGQYVRSRCSTDFATQRQLLTRVSTQRSPPPEAERQKVDLFAETAVRAPPPVLTQPAPTQSAAGDTGVATAVARPAFTAPMPAPTETGVPTSTDRPAGVAVTASALAVTETGARTSTDRPAIVAGPASASALTEPGVRTSTDRPAADVSTSASRPAAVSATAETDPAREKTALPGAMSRPAVTTPTDPEFPVVSSPASSQVGSPSLTTGELAAAISPKRGPAALVLGVVVVLSVGAAILFALRKPELAVVAEAVDAGGLVVPEPQVVDAGLAEALIDAGVELVAVPVEPPPVEQPTMRLAGRLAGNEWLVTNQGDQRGTRCRMTLPGQRVMEFGTLPRGTAELPLRRFVFDAKAPQLSGQARVDCEQGYGLIPLR